MYGLKQHYERTSHGNVYPPCSRGLELAFIRFDRIRCRFFLGRYAPPRRYRGICVGGTFCDLRGRNAQQELSTVQPKRNVIVCFKKHPFYLGVFLCANQKTTLSRRLLTQRVRCTDAPPSLVEHISLMCSTPCPLSLESR